MNHLGTNPVNGGKPPKESRLKPIKVALKGEEKLDWTKLEIVVDWSLWNINVIEKVIKK